MFSKMSDKEFKQFFLDMKNDENKNFYVEMDLYGKSKIGMSNIEAAAKVLNLPLEEYVYFRHKSPDGTVYRSPYKVPIIYLHLKRMQQILSKKTLMNYEIMGPGVRSRMTGSLSDSAKSGRLTDSKLVESLNLFNCWKLLRALSTYIIGNNLKDWTISSEASYSY